MHHHARAMQYLLVCYDIAQPRRLQKVARLLEGYGQRLQYSVFLCYLAPPLLAQLKDRAAQLMHPDEDSIVYIPLCGVCHDAIEVYGHRDLPPVDATCVIV
jgi:CRISPR-associated protein Cas2